MSRLLGGLGLLACPDCKVSICKAKGLSLADTLVCVTCHEGLSHVVTIVNTSPSPLYPLPQHSYKIVAQIK